MKEHSWETYEQVAVYLLNEFAEALGLERVEGKQEVGGTRSGTRWEIDGKAVKIGGEGFLVIECRRYNSSKQKQEQVAALAYRIQDVGADGGIIVSPLGLQKGAAKIAEAEKIETVYMNENSTRTSYLLKFLNTAFVGLSDTVTATTQLKIEVIRGTDN
jgi:hypothetical protein